LEAKSNEALLLHQQPLCAFYSHRIILPQRSGYTKLSISQDILKHAIC
jgi:hypothetical protein